MCHVKPWNLREPLYKLVQSSCKAHVKPWNLREPLYKLVELRLLDLNQELDFQFVRKYTLCEELIFKFVLGAELYQLLGDFH